MDPEGLARYVLSTYPDLVRSAVIQSFEPARVRLVFSDGTYMDIRYNERGRYSYHWQRGEGTEYRFDNAPHHREVTTHPHHLHDSSGNVLPSDVRGVSPHDVDEVMRLVRTVTGGH